MVAWYECLVQLCHLTILIIPTCILRLDGDDATLHVVYVIFILAQGQADDSHVNFAVDTFGVKTFFQHDTCLVTNLHGLLDGLGDRLDRLLMYYLLGRFLMLHDGAEDGKEKPQQCQAEVLVGTVPVSTFRFLSKQ